jgi:hypothetical protein
MATLVSPGVDVQVIDESFYGSAGPGTVPFIVIATQEDKLDPSGSAIAEGTTSENAGSLYLITSQRELLQTFGDPQFYSVGGTARHAYPLNEYGLLAAHSYLGIANRAYIMRADVDLAQLEPSDTAPVGDPTAGTYWLDLSETELGLFAYNQAESSWDLQTVSVLTNENLIDSNGVPVASAPGAIGSFTMVAGVVEGAGSGREENQIFRRAAAEWELLDASAISENVIYRSHTQVPYEGEVLDLSLTSGGTGHAVDDVLYLVDASTATGSITAFADATTATTVTSAAHGLSNGDYVTIVGTTNYDGTYAISGVTTDTFNISASYVVDDATGEWADKRNLLEITVTEVNTGTITDFTILDRGDGYDGTSISQLGTSGAGTGFTGTCNVLADGDFWIKTSSPDYGADFSVKWYDVDASSFIEVDAPLARTRDDALLLYGNNPQSGDLFVQYDMNNESTDDYNFGTNSRAEFSLMMHNGAGTTVIEGTVESPTVSDGDAMIINGTTVTFDLATPSDSALADIVAAINNANISNITAEATDDDTLQITHATGLDVSILDSTGTPTTDIGLSSDIAVTNGYVHSNWSYLVYEASSIEPTTTTPDGTLWYSTNLQVDMLENNGQGAWDEISGTVYLQSAQPTTGMSSGDYWIDSDQIGEYPVISKYTGSQWIQLDNTDQTSPNGILFRDARPSPTFGNDLGANNGETAGFPDLDADAPDPLMYPRGMLLFNTRYSTYNVKRWESAYTYDGELIGGRWVTESGNKEDGSPYMGSDAVKEIIVERMQSAIAASEDVRAESIFFNLLAAPGYPEMIDELITLNTDRKLTGFVIGDTPFTLSPASTDLQNWAQNASGAPTNGDDGLVTSDTYLGVYYPSGFTTNVDGEDVVVPASHIMLRTMAFNDQVAYQWFAPAGYQRGVVTNAVNVGYVTEEEEFETVELNQGQRDVLYTNNINPIAFRPNQGLVVFGQKTRHPVSSALDRINVVRLINYIRYQAPFLAEPYLFEPNDDITRSSVKNSFDRFLEGLITLRALNDFLVVCDDSNNTPARIDRNELWVDLLIQPLKAVEFIYIPVRVRNTGSDLTLAS